MVMNDKRGVPDAPIKIRYKGVYDMRGLLGLVYRWYTDNQYEYHEKLYKDKIETAFGNEVEIKMVGQRKITEYYMYEVIVEIHNWESKDIMIKVNSKEVPMMQGRIEIKISGKLITDWQNKFEAGTIWEKAQTFLEKVVLKQDINLKYVDPIERGVHAFAAEIKTFLKMDTV
jgi:hypothetical protein